MLNDHENKKRQHEAAQTNDPHQWWIKHDFLIHSTLKE